MKMPPEGAGTQQGVVMVRIWIAGALATLMFGASVLMVASVTTAQSTPTSVKGDRLDIKTSVQDVFAANKAGRITVALPAQYSEADTRRCGSADRNDRSQRAELFQVFFWASDCRRWMPADRSPASEGNRSSGLSKPGLLAWPA